MKKVRVPQAGPFLRRIVFAVCLMMPGRAAVSAEVHPAGGTTASIENRIRVLETNEQYLSAFALSVEHLKHNVPPTTANRAKFLDALTNVVRTANLSGQQALADDLARLLIAESKQRAGSNDVRTANAWRLYGSIARGSRGPSESWKALEEARCILESANATETEEYSHLLWSTGNWYRWRDQDASLAYLDRAMILAEYVDPEPSKDAADRATWVGWTLLHLGRHDEARIQFQRAKAMYGSLGLTDVSAYGTLLAAEGDLAAIDEDWVTAEGRYRAATRVFESAWAKRGASSRNIPLHGYHLMAMAQAKQGMHEKAWRSLQRYRAGQAIRASVGAASWRVDHDPEYDHIQGMYNRLLANRASLQALKESPRVTPETWRALIDQLEVTAQCARAETDYVLSHPVPEVSIEHLQSRLQANTAYIGWLDAWFGDDLSVSTARFRRIRWMYVVRPAQPIRWIPVYEMTTRAEHVDSKPVRDYKIIMARSASWRERLEDDPELADLSTHFYRDVFGTEPFELPGVDRLIAEVACNDEWMNISAFVDPTGRYLSERYAVSYTPSAAVYVALSESPRPNRDRGETTVLAVGDPWFPKSGASASTDSRIDEITLRGAVNHDTAALDRLPPLPYSRRELDRVQALFPDSRVLRGSEASEASINQLAARQELDDFDIVHLASHALVDVSPERCAIALSRKGVGDSISNDGLIDTPEIRMGWKLDAELVTLSACQTAGLGYHRGEPMGFAQPLFQAGARCVLLSLWKVDDEATSLLMSRFYENVASYNRTGTTISYSTALNDAKNWLRNHTDEKGKQPFAHPVYWSGFVLIGDAN